MNSLTLDTIQTDTTQLPTSAVQLIMADIGLNPYSKTKPVIWARNIVIAGGKRFVSTCDPKTNWSNFERWLAACPRAVGIMTDGTIRLPHIPESGKEDSLALLSDALNAARGAIALQLLKALGMSLTFLVTGFAIVGAVLAYNSAHPFSPGLIQFGVLGIVLVLGGVVAGIPGLVLMPQRSRIVQILAELKIKGELRSDLLAKSIAPRQPV